MPDRDERFVQSTSAFRQADNGKELYQLIENHSMEEAESFFQQEKKSSSLMKNACNEAERLLDSGKVGKNLGHLSSLTRSTKVAIVAFTLNEPNIFFDFNRQSRDLRKYNWHSFPYKGMWLLMNKAILSHGQKSDELLYRGVDNVSVPNDTFCFRQITSTSTKRDVANCFSAGGTLFILKSPLSLSIRPLSVFPGEDEHILPAFLSFEVMQTKKQGSTTEIYLNTTGNDEKCSIL